MKNLRAFRTLTLLAGGFVLLQAGGCSFGAVNDTLQTVLLGITAAGGIAIIRNI